jgi:hypothetical protein
MTFYKNLHGTLVEEPTTSMHPGPKMNVPCPVGPQILPFHKSEFPRKLCRSVIHIMQPSVNQTEKFIKIPIRGPGTRSPYRVGPRMKRRLAVASRTVQLTPFPYMKRAAVNLSKTYFSPFPNSPVTHLAWRKGFVQGLLKKRTHRRLGNNYYYYTPYMQPTNKQLLQLIGDPTAPPPHHSLNLPGIN